MTPVLLALLLGAPVPPQGPAAERVAEAVARVFADPGYRLLEEERERAAGLTGRPQAGEGWLERLRRRVGAVFARLGEALLRALPWRVLLLVAGSLVVLLLLGALYRAAGRGEAEGAAGRRGEGATVPPPAPQRWLAAAEEAARRGEWAAALRHLLQAAFAQLAARRGVPLPRGATNRELLGRLAPPELRPALGALVAAVDRSYYGNLPAEAEAYRAARAALFGKEGS